MPKLDRVLVLVKRVANAKLALVRRKLVELAHRLALKLAVLDPCVLALEVEPLEDLLLALRPGVLYALVWLQAFDAEGDLLVGFERPYLVLARILGNLAVLLPALLVAVVVALFPCLLSIVLLRLRQVLR